MLRVEDNTWANNEKMPQIKYGNRPMIIQTRSAGKLQALGDKHCGTTIWQRTHLTM